MSYTHKQVIVIRKDLKMRRGKEIAQGCHASMGAILKLGQYFTAENAEGSPTHTFVANLDDRVSPWLMGRFAKIVVTVDSESALLELNEQAEKAHILSCLIKDAGFTEFRGVPTYTALAIGPDYSDMVDQITKELPLY
jgi:PTH2 family peptidyl-tRNA hydrolase